MPLTTLDLLHAPEPRTPRWKSVRARIRAWWAARRGRLSVVFAEAVSIHAAVIIALLLTQSSSLAGRREPDTSNLETIRQTLAELSRNPDNPGFKGGTAAEEEALAKALDEALRVSAETDRKRKAEIVKAMIRSFFRMRDVQGGSYADVSRLTTDEIQAMLEQSGMLRLPSGEKAFSARGADPAGGFQLYTLERGRETQIQRMLRDEKAEKEAADRFGDQVRLASRYPDAKGMRSMPQEVYFRKCPFEAILARGSSLFTAVRGFPRFTGESSGGGGGEAKKAKPKPAAPAKTDPNLLTVYLITSPAPSGPGRPDGTILPPAEISEAQLSEILDRWMTLPEAKQWSAFDKDYLQRYPADSPDLANMARRFIAANLNGVFYITDDFATAFDFVEEIHYKRPIYDALAVYALRHPLTRTAAEFLFSLADAYDFERRTLLAVQDVEADAADMLANRSRRTSAFGFKAKAYVLKELAGDLRADLNRRGLAGVEGASRRYRKEILAIYAYLAEMGGEIRNRALYAAGLTLWEEGRAEDAFAAWREIAAGYPLRAYRLIQPYLQRSGPALSDIVQTIGEILASDAQEGNAPLLRRQLKFHKWTARAETLIQGERP
ncbi:MAG: hypothetical protein PHI34_00695 [Acidobacteriota bacterium]|nr:hypothetical protein [Acidobacteriota bacterium]